MRYMLTADEWGADESYRFGLTQAVTSGFWVSRRMDGTPLASAPSVPL
jgi:hypothetical protein